MSRSLVRNDKVLGGEGKRDSSVDIIKGWAILTIIISHCSSGCFSQLTGSLIGNPWNVPIFFIIAGFFLKQQSLVNPATFLKTKFKRLYIPATVTYAACILLHNLFVLLGWYPIGEVHPSNGIPFDYFGLKETTKGLVKVILACGSGELAMGAMWFLYSLLYSFIAMTFIYWLVSKIWKTEQSRFYVMTIILLLIAVASCIFSQKFDFTINRISPAMTAMFLIWWGMIVNQHVKLDYNSIWVFVASLIVFIHCAVMQGSTLKLATNEYQDLVFLVVGSTAAIYVWRFVAHRIERNFIGKFLSMLGRESLYLMMFHILGFFICNSLMVQLGVFSLDDVKGLYTYSLHGNYLLLAVYVIFGVSVPLIIINLGRSMVALFKKYSK